VATEQTPPTSIVASLPKAELHLHLEGSIRPDTAVELAARRNETHAKKSLLVTTPELHGLHRNIRGITSFLRTPDDYALITRHLAEELLRQNGCMPKLRFLPALCLADAERRGKLEAIRETAQSVPFRRLRTAYIFDGPTVWSGSNQWRLRDGPETAGFRVVAFDIWRRAGGPTTSFRPAFDCARRAPNVPRGEIGGPDSVREAVEISAPSELGTNRRDERSALAELPSSTSFSELSVDNLHRIAREADCVGGFAERPSTAEISRARPAGHASTMTPRYFTPICQRNMRSPSR
jgi:adenosine deaminase/aminodeoxyfutalosine deaminase